MTKVPVEEVETRLNSGQETTFIDSRSDDAWSKAKVKAGGAIRIPPDEAEKHFADVSRDDYIVTYCT